MSNMALHKSATNKMAHQRDPTAARGMRLTTRQRLKDYAILGLVAGQYRRRDPPLELFSKPA